MAPANTYNLLEGRPPLPIGTERVRNGYLFVKTSKGWEYRGPVKAKSVKSPTKTRKVSKVRGSSKAKVNKAVGKTRTPAAYLSVVERETYKKKHAEGLSQEEHFAASEYTGDAYKDINDSLRHGFELGSYGNVVTLLDGIIARNSFDKSVKVTRFAGPSALKKLGGLSPGDTFIDKGFVSTTSVSEDDMDDVMAGLDGVISKFRLQMNIIIPKGKSAAFLPSSNPYEEEVVLPRNTTFKVKAKSLGPKMGDERVVIMDVEVQ